MGIAECRLAESLAEELQDSLPSIEQIELKLADLSVDGSSGRSDQAAGMS